MKFVYFGHFEKRETNQSTYYQDIKKGFVFIINNKQLLYLILTMIPIAFSGKVFEVLILSLSEQDLVVGEVGGIGVYLLFTFLLGVSFVALGSI